MKMFKWPTEQRYFGVDFSDQQELAEGQTLSGTPTFTKTLLSGSDTLVIGTGVVQGTRAIALHTSGTLGATYRIEVSATTSGGQVLNGLYELEIKKVD